MPKANETLADHLKVYYLMDSPSVLNTDDNSKAKAQFEKVIIFVMADTLISWVTNSMTLDLKQLSQKSRGKH